MGADQIGFLFKGPARLNRSKKTIRAATDRATAVLRALRRLHELDDLPDKLPPELRHLRRDEVEEVLHILDTLPEPRVAVGDLLNWWTGGARDTATRADPDNPTQIIGFAGDRSWGDEPDGVGYRTYQAATYLDILSTFGIR